jgi:multidrug resistance efflux pump
MVLALLAFGCNRREKPVQPVRKDITQAIYASGKAYPTHYYRVVASVPGYLGKLLVDVGAPVKVGQPLFTVQNDAGSFNLAASQNTLAQAKRNASTSSPLLKAAQDEVVGAQAKLRLDSLSYARYAGLQQAGAGTRQALDQARTLFETSRAAYLRSVDNLEATRQRLGTERSNAEAAYNALRAGQDNYTVYSTINGMVYDQVPRLGEYVGPSTIVMEIGETHTFEVELAIDEADLNLLKTGQKVFFASEALGKSLAYGVITRVYPKISAQSKSIKAISTLVLPAGKTVFAGTTLEANIVCTTKKQVLTLPKVYVHNDSITVRENGEFVRKPVTLGLEDADFAEVLKGVTPETEVYR